MLLECTGAKTVSQTPADMHTTKKHHENATATMTQSGAACSAIRQCVSGKAVVIQRVLILRCINADTENST